MGSNDGDDALAASTPYHVPTIGEAVDGGQDRDGGDGEGEFEGADEIKGSMCMSCGGDGTTRMLTTKIPMFREVILSSFECDDCHWKNNEVTFGGELQEKGCRFDLKVTSAEDLNRQVVKSDFATVKFVELDFEIPPAQRGEVTTVEGLLRTSAERLGEAQDLRMERSPEIGAQIAGVIARLAFMSAGVDSEFPFTMVVDDPSGNSFVENPSAPNKDPALTTVHYVRTATQDMSVGLQPSQEAVLLGTVDATSKARPAPREVEGSAALIARATKPSLEDEDAEEGEGFMKKEAVRLPENCPACGAPGESLTCIADIPHFKEVMIMAFDCAVCGFKSSEVKGGGAIPPKGTVHTLNATSKDDFRRDVLKSDTAVLELPQLELVMEMGTLGSMYTTVEGLLNKACASLVEGNPFFSGDSATEHHGKESEVQRKFRVFLEKFRSLIEGETLPFTLVVRDPLGNSFVGSAEHENPVDDPNITVEWFERTFEENEELGLNDMNTAEFETVPEGYEGGASSEGKGESERNPSHLIPHRVGTDHPTPFTKGQEEEDTTKTDGVCAPAADA
eukprot:jgi/Undpi1/5989/HiC_scaffold_2.g01263.m1